ncbi:MAG: hypothetical protein WAW80_04280 [Candidatus Saccharimonadales bacterium]
MKNVFSALRGLNKSTKFIVATLVAAAIVPATLFAWGPTRPTYTAANPADHITFNSITDDPDYGDERNFVRIKDTANTNAGGWSDEINVENGKEYWVQMYVHNNAASNLNLVAQNVRVTAAVPNNTAKSITVEGFVDSSNATPTQVFDQAVFNSDSDFNLTYVPGSTALYNKVFPNGTPMSDNIVNPGGTPFGYDKLDGNLPGCFNYSGYVSFKVKVNKTQTANFNVTKQVSKHGASNWQKSYAAQPGEVVDYIVRYKNTADALQKDVMVKDTLPDGMTYVPGSTSYATVEHPNGIGIDDGVTTTGVNIGDYSQNGGTWVRFSAKVAENNSLPACGNNTLHNVARVETDFGYKEDSADVTVTRVCQPGEQPPVIELPQTGIDGPMAFIGLGALTASIAYAIRSGSIRNLLRR